MAALVEEESYPCTMNLVPCLLEQMEEYSRGQGVVSLQKALEKEPVRLCPCQVARLAKFLRGGAGNRSRSELQAAALQSFFSPLLDPPEDKEALLALQQKTHKQMIPYFRKLHRGGAVELITSAYYHPLLPLLYDIGVGGESLTPSLRFSHPEDGAAQIEKGRTFFKRIFGDNPQGFWPSEGGISAAVAREVAGLGYAFAVTDENILWKSQAAAPQPQLLFRPYVCEGLNVFFRDRELSDLLSFEYWKWDEKEAVAHFLAQLQKRRELASDEAAICVIALDGENPWGGYKLNGVPFLREFYDRLKKQEGIHPVFFQDFLAVHKPKTEIKLVPGTWMGNFSKWLGSPAKNAGWDKLSLARELCGPREEIFIAEGSDWFWWFGEENTAEFESLFKSYLRKACAGKGKEFVDE
jgi:alpha-amylase/alpha-mannosidase (GH57 family)